MAKKNVDEKLSNADLGLLKERFLEWFAINHQKKLDILITGKTGVGKSRLVNGLVGRAVAKEGRAREQCTIDVTPYSVVIDGIEVRVWDAPGLQDGIHDEELYLNKLVDKLRHGFDVMIYCIKMDDKRFYVEDKKAIKVLTRGFGKDLWKKAMIALTFANRVEDPDEEDELAYFLGEQQFWEKAIDDFLRSELNIARQVRHDLPIVPAGNYKKLHLPTGDQWLAELWIKCFSVMTHSAGLALYKINKNRVKFSISAEMARACSSQSANEPTSTNASEDTENQGDIPATIPLNEKQESTFWRKLWGWFKTAIGWDILHAAGSAVLKGIFLD